MENAFGPTPEERNWAVALHLSPLANFIAPLLGILAPFCIWLLKKDDSAYLNHQGKEVLNFIITIFLIALAIFAVYAIGIVLSIILIGIPILVLAGALWAGLGLVWLIFALIAAYQAHKGIAYRYPINFRLIR